MDWLHQLHDPEGLKRLIVSGGVILLVGIIFAETGLLVGFFLPGDSLLFLAGALCAVNLLEPSAPPPLDFTTTAIALTIAAIIGNSVNYWLGHWAGDRIWNRPDGRFIKRRYLEEAHALRKMGRRVVGAHSFRADCADVRAVHCWRLTHELCPLHAVECHWSRGVGAVINGRRHLARSITVRAEKSRGHRYRRHRHLNFADDHWRPDALAPHGKVVQQVIVSRIVLQRRVQNR